MDCELGKASGGRPLEMEHSVQKTFGSPVAQKHSVLVGLQRLVVKPDLHA
jgi:hypothetical protein